MLCGVKSKSVTQALLEAAADLVQLQDAVAGLEQRRAEAQQALQQVENSCHGSETGKLCCIGTALPPVHLAWRDIGS